MIKLKEMRMMIIEMRKRVVIMTDTKKKRKIKKMKKRIL